MHRYYVLTSNNCLFYFQKISKYNHNSSVFIRFYKNMYTGMTSLKVGIFIKNSGENPYRKEDNIHEIPTFDPKNIAILWVLTVPSFLYTVLNFL